MVTILGFSSDNSIMWHINFLSVWTFVQWRIHNNREAIKEYVIYVSMFFLLFTLDFFTIISKDIIV